MHLKTAFKWGAALMFVLTTQGSSVFAQAPLEARILETKKVWDRAKHNAFTDLLYWKGAWFCAFREAKSHVGSQGVLRVLQSDDADNWESAAVVRDPTYDLRDAKLSITPSGDLMITGGAQTSADGRLLTGTITAVSSDGVEWTSPEMVVEPGRWVWDLAWRNGVAWGVSYAAPEGTKATSLVRTTDGRQFETHVEEFFAKTSYPNEARIRFDAQGAAYCLQRSDGDQDAAYLGVSTPPYQRWEWKSLERFIGGPSLLQLPSGEWLAAGRIFENGQPKTAVLSLDVEAGAVETLAVLPSGGDCSYPGLDFRDGVLRVSYYSSHEGKASIYLAKLAIDSPS
ncbi:hypothetical protein K2D_25520 [Planctomycetes bacterium K2D]|nr:hypothetical protein K2D_25520 [Planctomycetes bacterium K2D]